ncbi:GA26239, related [Neospora caninum Liverpool]|uniref:GA26239, related n=1 Tax=Neospora caninum (strain Liverpool) TaxID=572307 RepID=F0VGJ3_NEOCL|nr:GA26239, related [Neospora caninum Liverpool]CBZ52837.1 GA26239, related [Neospora caninum Liverpool]|eukprot:XP_003882869.1 GA26239, related [Neospora caninum Liverpool]
MFPAMQGASSEREDFFGYMSHLVAMEDVPTDSEATALDTAPALPPPRCNHTASLWESNGRSKIVVFGGHGGYKYTRKAFNDVWVLDLDELTWAEGNFHVLSLQAVRSDMDLPWRGSPPRWNCGYQLVEAIPDWKVFVFGGNSSDSDSSQRRSDCTLLNDVGVLTLGSAKRWDAPALEEVRKPTRKSTAPSELERKNSLNHVHVEALETSRLAPRAREHAAMAYDAEESLLVLFGGWVDDWLDDIWTLNVSSIVGPPYAITCIAPDLGPVTGNTQVSVRGAGFTEGIITVRFQAHDQHVDVPAEFVSATEVVARTACVKGGIESRPCEVRVKIGGKDFTTTWTTFHYYKNTVAKECLAFGPGLLQEGSTAAPTMFVIQARNGAGENRTSGSDVFKVVVTHHPRDNPEQSVELDVEILDQNNGKYIVKYHAKTPGEAIVDVSFVDEGKAPEPLRGSPFLASFVDRARNRANDMAGPLVTSYISRSIAEMEEFHAKTEAGVQTVVKADDVKTLLAVRHHISQMEKQKDSLLLQRETVQAVLSCLEHQGATTEANSRALKNATSKYNSLERLVKKREKEVQGASNAESLRTRKRIAEFEQAVKETQINLKSLDFYFFQRGIDNATQSMDAVEGGVTAYTSTVKELETLAASFGFVEDLDPAKAAIAGILEELNSVRVFWTFTRQTLQTFASLLETPWGDVDAPNIEQDVKRLQKGLKDLKIDRKCDAYLGLHETLKRWLVFIPLVAELRDGSMRARHWAELLRVVNADGTEIADDMPLKTIERLQLWNFQGPVEEITDRAKQEAVMEKTLKMLETTWSEVPFDQERHKDTDVVLLNTTEEKFEMLEEHLVQCQNMITSRFFATFETAVLSWQKTLSNISEVTQLLREVQRSWTFLENLFIYSEEVKKELPEQASRFVHIDASVKAILALGRTHPVVRDFCATEGILKRLEDAEKELSVCEKALNEFMDSKRRLFPRFYFVSSVDLLDILSNGNSPAKVMQHMSKIFQAVQAFQLEGDCEAPARPAAVGMESCVGKESVKFPDALMLTGNVENYLYDCITSMQRTLLHYVKKSLKDRWSKPSREEWILTDPVAQVTLLVDMAVWVFAVESAFSHLEQGDAPALRRALAAHVDELTATIKMVQGELTPAMRQRLMCLITVDTHGRDVLARLIEEGAASKDAFQWQSQLKYHWSEAEDTMRVNITDASFVYGYEYLGNGPRLVVTPLTDRIYVTAAQALHLCMGCAPAGPAGTGKTETTKDLASALGKACYVFNCSDQMDYQSMGNIFKGLAASGAWGCFDEFNRLIPAVLSVCSVQFKAVVDAIKAGVSRFTLQGDEIALDPTCGVFITMNPGYLGRSELPEGLKTLFRPITVMVPDLELICENMLMAEGFVEAKVLARKFTRLYALCRDLLSKAAHYDWGLRAIKSVLVVAGSFKRAEPDLPEKALLMRALRDTNIAKIVADDLKIFSGLLADLFPGVDPPRLRDMDFEAVVEATCWDAGLTAHPEFVLKVVQLQELLKIRHCVFVMGPAGAGKSSVWKTLARAQDQVGLRTTFVDINPKAVSPNELYGYVKMSTREWKDGLLSKTMRSLGQIQDTSPKWILLDGDLDANWIESMNSVMDDNKILTLASNERIPLRPHMRMLFEIRDLNFATPATVSRAGILFISDTAGHQWRSYAQSWIKRMRWSDEVKTQLQKLFDKYCPATLAYIQRNCKLSMPIVNISLVASLCAMLESSLGDDPQALEYAFVFCCIWACGGCLHEKDGIDYRRQFSNWWRNEWKTIKFPSKGTVFDYFVGQAKLELWEQLVPETDFDADKPVGDLTVPTPETVAMLHFVGALVKIHAPVMLIGLAGCGKTQLCKGLLRSLDKETYASCVINFNFYTDSALLQTLLEQPLEKKAGRQYGPPGKLRLVYFLDDLNMPQLDPYNTQTAIALLRQHMDYQHWYDRNKMQLKDISNTQCLACLNPAAGSFTVNPRLQRHFWTLSTPLPEQTSLFTIYNTILSKYFEKKNFRKAVQEQISFVVKATLSLHSELLDEIVGVSAPRRPGVELCLRATHASFLAVLAFLTGSCELACVSPSRLLHAFQVVQAFRKTAANFHYEFNMRHLSSVFQSLLAATPQLFQEAEKLVILWLHECERTYRDRLVSQADCAKYEARVADLAKKMFGKFNVAKFFQAKNPETLIFCHFARGFQDPGYDRIGSMAELSQLLQEALTEYNDVNPVMDLVLFEDAMKHVCRITRIINNSGHALLVGIGGSGKQSLAKLSAFISSCMPFQVTISSKYDVKELKNDLRYLYNRAGLKDEGVLFLFNESQCTDEHFLVYINDLLASGDIADLFEPEDKDQILNAVRPAVKAAGLPETKDALWDFFISRIKKNLHMALCFSPVGDNIRNCARKFPAIVNCTIIDWFQPWPAEALLSVSAKFLAPLPLGDDDVRRAVVEFMPYAFYSVNEAAQEYLANEKRYAYITPKTFIESTKLYGAMLQEKIDSLKSKSDRLSSGLNKLIDTKEKVSALEDDLKEKTIVVEEKKAAADAFAERVGEEKAKVTAESEKANLEAQTCAEIQRNVSEQRSSCEEDLAKAIPLVQQAEAALNTLNKKDFQEAKSLNKPPPGVDDITTAVMHLLAGVDPNIEVDKQGKLKDKSWKGAQKMMNNPEKFLQTLKDFKQIIDDGRVPEHNFKAVEPLLALPHFNREAIQKKSTAAAGLAEWVINIYQFYKVVDSVAPKRRALEEATQQLEEANAKLAVVQELVAELEEKLGKLVAEYDAAIAEKNAVEAEANKCRTKLDMAQRLMNALGSEGTRWQQSIENFNEELRVMVGDVLLASSFVAYAGVFTKKYRDWLKNEKFAQFLRSKHVPMSPEPNPLLLLTSDAEMAMWNNQGLPSDQVSLENGAILTNSQRWCLLVDPQLQGSAWIKKREQSNNLQVTRLQHPRLIQTMESSISFGFSVLLENLDESIEAVLAPVVSRQTIKRGRSLNIKLGDKEIPYNANFRLFLQTPLSNPHYPPEIQAECTIINFTVTEKGLEDQLLALTIQKEHPDLSKKRVLLIQQQNDFKITLAELESTLLEKLAAAEGDILEDTELILNLEKTKSIATEVSAKVALAKKTGERLDTISEQYRPVARRGAVLFFLLSELFKMHTFYVYSMEAFVAVIHRAIDSVANKPPESAEPDGDEVGGAAEEASGEVDASPPSAEEEAEQKAGETRKKKARRSREGDEGDERSEDGDEEHEEVAADDTPSEASDAEADCREGAAGAEEKSSETDEDTTRPAEGEETRDAREAATAGQPEDGETPASGGTLAHAPSVGGVTRGEMQTSGRVRPQSAASSRSGKSAEPVPAARGESENARRGAETAQSAANRDDAAETREAQGEAELKEEEDFLLEDVDSRVATLVETITKFLFMYCNRGLFERHKLTFAVLLALRILVDGGVIDDAEAQLLIYSRVDASAPPMPESAKSWMTEVQWGCCRSLEQSPVFKNNSVSLLQNFDQDSPSWKRWFAEEKAEAADLPRTFRGLSLFHRILLLRCLRPDRMIAALKEFVLQHLGTLFVEPPLFNMREAYFESDKNTPIFFVLFPGVDPTPAVEDMARTVGCTAANGKFVNISMGQGQETLAIQAVEKAAVDGGWVMLQNVHLMQDWLKILQRTLEQVAETGHKDFRCVISSEPPPLPDMKIIPERTLQRSIKIADEAPQDLKANLRRAFGIFSAERLESCAKSKEFKGLVFNLCFFHAVILGRKKFGSLGWSKIYSFNVGDLNICGNVLRNFLDKSSVVPYEDIRYIFGEIMYGGHITDAFDRRTNNTYLKTFIVPEALSGMQLAPNLKCPDPSKSDHAAYSKYIEDKTPAETPQMFGLHPNAEIGYLSAQGESLFANIQVVLGSGGGSQKGQRKEDILKATVAQLLVRVPHPFDLPSIKARVREFHPFVVVCLQEVERMNTLLSEVHASLEELEKGLAGQLNITEAMEQFSNALFAQRVPETWKKVSYLSNKTLAPWISDLLERVKQLESWTAELTLLPSLWISGLFNPMSFLTAIMQASARSDNLPLDDMCLRWTVSSIQNHKDVPGAPESGVYIHGLVLEGAAWDDGKGTEGNIVESRPKELFSPLPVINVSAIQAKDFSWENMYECPVYVTAQRGPSFVCTANLRMDMDDTVERWVLAGVAMLMAEE